MKHAARTPQNVVIANAVHYLSRVIPRGPQEADELLHTIETLRRLTSTPVQSR